MLFPLEIIIKICKKSENPWLYLLSGYCNLNDLMEMNFFPNSRFLMQDLLSIKYYRYYIKILLVINEYLEELKTNFKNLEEDDSISKVGEESMNWKTAENKKYKICLDTFYIKDLYSESREKEIYKTINDNYFKVIHSYIYKLGYTKEFLNYAKINKNNIQNLYKYNINYYGSYTNIDYYTFNYGKAIGNQKFDNKIHNLTKYFNYNNNKNFNNNINNDNINNNNDNDINFNNETKYEKFHVDSFENSYTIIDTNENKYYISEIYEVPYIVINKEYKKNPDKFIIDYAHRFVKYEIQQLKCIENFCSKKFKFNNDDYNDNFSNTNSNKNDKLRITTEKNNYNFNNIDIRTVILSFFNIRDRDNLIYLDKLLELRGKHDLDTINLQLNYSQMEENLKNNQYNINNRFIIDNPNAYLLYDEIYSICLKHGYIQPQSLHDKSFYYFKPSNLFYIYNSYFNVLLKRLFNDNIDLFFSYIDLKKDSPFIQIYLNYSQFDSYIDFLYYLLDKYDKNYDHTYPNYIFEEESIPISFDDTITKKFYFKSKSKVLRIIFANYLIYSQCHGNLFYNSINEVYQSQELILSELNEWKERNERREIVDNVDLSYCYEIIDNFEKPNEVESWKKFLTILLDNL